VDVASERRVMSVVMERLRAWRTCSAAVDRPYPPERLTPPFAVGRVMTAASQSRASARSPQTSRRCNAGASGAGPVDPWLLQSFRHGPAIGSIGGRHVPDLWLHEGPPRHG
jgi:hypothetical protein